MSYPGDSSLSADLKERIQKTFAQTLELTQKGSVEEARLGCDFILRMDPQFELAQALLDRLGGEGPIEIDDLRRGEVVKPEPSPGGFELEAVDEIDDFDDLELDFEVPAATIATPIEELPPIAPPAAQPIAESGLGAAMEELLAKRDPQRVIKIAEENRDEVAADPGLRKMVENAYSLLESEPYVREFLDKARLAIQEGNAGEAHQLIEKARSLDPEHPGIVEIEQAQGFYNDPARRMGNRRDSPPASGLAAEVEQDSPNETLFEPSSMVPPTVPEIEPPPAAAPAPPPTPAASSASGGDDRIQELLDQGQEAYARDDFQSAIDAWSRIFLIDIDHEEAARRIEEARGRKAENERRVEEVYQEALTAFDAGERERAKELFERVIELAPNHLASREYLGQLERRPEPPPVPPAPSAPEAEAAPAEPPPFDSVFDEDLPDVSLHEEIFEPPTDAVAARRAPEAAAPVPPPVKGPAKSGRGRSISNFLYIGGAVLVLVAALGYLAWDQREKWFPNSQPEETVAVDEPSTLEKARALWEEGKEGAATRLLELMPEDDAAYDEAQEQLASWAAEEVEGEPEEVEAGEEGLSLGRLVRYQELLDRARQAVLDREYLLAERYFSRAALIRELQPEDQESLTLAQQQLEPLSQQIELFEDDDWQYLLPTLWSMLEAEPDNRDVIRLIVDSYYNLGVRDLQRGKAELAAQKFREAQRLRAEDAEVQRHLAFSETYTQRPKDLLYRIYIKYLPFR